MNKKIKMKDIGYMIDIFEYMKPYFKVKALHAAFELGLIQRLMNHEGHMTKEALCRGIDSNKGRCSFILRVLGSYKIIHIKKEEVYLSANFIRDYTSYGVVMLQTIKYMNLAYRDFESLDSLNRIGDSRGLISNFWKKENSKGFSAFMSVFSKLELNEICKIFDFSRCKHVLDIGGNDGEFVLGLCQLYPPIKGSVVDRPLVCQLGRKKLRHFPESQRIEFLPGDFLVDDFPKTADLIVFKSVLNDWNDAKVILLLQKAYRALLPGGRIIIIEFMTDGGDDDDKRLFEIAFQYLIGPEGYGRFRRGVEYGRFLKQAGFNHIGLQKMRMMNFSLIVAQKGKSEKAVT